ncbi:MAG: spiro-SPASM protein [Spirochaetaceae bacterium]|jgi:spiro-SPASM protein|nr:spiro-SPASM protein [Spirochaetaceae bacterium]
MNHLVFFAENSSHPFEARFGGESAFFRALRWASSLPSLGDVRILAFEERLGEVERTLAAFQGDRKLPPCTVKAAPEWTPRLLLQTLREETSGTVIFALASCPFYDPALTRELLSHHGTYAGEYTFAEGYPEGLVPAAVDAGALQSLWALVKDAPDPGGPVSHRTLFDLMRPHVNSFEVETLTAKQDLRFYRFDFSCSGLRETLVCEGLYKKAAPRGDFSAETLGDLARSSPEILRTVPSFYALQISAFTGDDPVYSPYAGEYCKKFGHPPWEAREKNPRCFMPVEDAEGLLSQAASLSGEAVVSLSAWGDPLAHPRCAAIVGAALSHPGISLLVETDGALVTRELAESLRALCDKAPGRTGKHGKIYWIVYIDGMDEDAYRRLHPAGERPPGVTLPTHGKAVEALDILTASFGKAVYPQFMRTTLNENQLESFYRHYKEKGNLIIQKYDSFCGKLPDLRPADLSPAERYPCWHLLRDMTVLADGGAPVCRERGLEAGGLNVFTEGVEGAWKRLGREIDLCGACDEYYTFNF